MARLGAAKELVVEPIAGHRQHGGRAHADAGALEAVQKSRLDSR
jgi:hypothetical protein